MKKAFTLIELLVVIAIIAILAAILFPVFAQAKAAAKKTGAISNQKQIGLAVIQYMADFDDYFPRNDDCIAGSSLNSDLKNLPFNPTGVGCTVSPFYNRVNHFAWQKWVLPYTKTVQVFEHPGRQKLDSASPKQWSQQGEMMGGLAINMALTGQLNSYNRSATSAGYSRNSWSGGNQGQLPDVSRCLMLFEFSNPGINFAPVITTAAEDSLPQQTAYPAAIREFWAGNYRQTDAGCNDTGKTDDRRVFANVIVVGFADGSAKAIPVGRWLEWTPTAAQYGATLTSSIKCGTSGGNIFNQPTPNTAIDFPFWGLHP